MSRSREADHVESTFTSHMRERGELPAQGEIETEKEERRMTLPGRAIEERRKTLENGGHKNERGKAQA